MKILLSKRRKCGLYMFTDRLWQKKHHLISSHLIFFEEKNDFEVTRDVISFPVKKTKIYFFTFLFLNKNCFKIETYTFHLKLLFAVSFNRNIYNERRLNGPELYYHLIHSFAWFERKKF
jgi:hypothetical protein